MPMTFRVFALAVSMFMSTDHAGSESIREINGLGNGSVLFAQANAAQNADGDKKKEPTPEEKMQARFPQNVKVGFLIGLPVLDGNDSTIGYIAQVVRTPTGKIKLIVPYGKHLGWLKNYGFTSSFRRPVPVPLEVVAILGRQVDALDMERDQFDSSPSWRAEDGEPIPSTEIIKIAIQRR